MCIKQAYLSCTKYTCGFTGVVEVYQQLCDGQGGNFPAFYSVSGSDLHIVEKDCDSYFRRGAVKGSTHLDAAVANMSSLKEPDHITKSIHYWDSLLYIYTSGTTGISSKIFTN